MSTFAYATLTNVRDDADPQKPENAKPGVNKYVDAMAALVPAEILGLHAILLSFTTEKASNDDGKVSTIISEPETLAWCFWGLIVMSVVLYLFGRGKKHVNKLDWLRLLIPPCAFVLWTMLQKATAFDAAFPDMGFVERMAIALFGAVFLGALAASLASKASEAPATS